MTLEGHTAFVSGAGRNIGRAIAISLAESGCNVVVNGYAHPAACEAVAGELEQRGVRALAVIGDVGDAGDVRRMAAEALGAFGTIDVVVNNAAIRPRQPLLEMSEDDWHRVMAVDLHAAFYTTKAFVPGMVERTWGRIISFTGMNAIAGHGGRSHVSTAKHGVWGFTKSLAIELGPSGITANAISPGPINTSRDDPEFAKHIKNQVERVPVRRLGESEDIAALCVFLASPQAGFISGQMIASNGAMTT